MTKRRILTIILTGALILSLAACGGGKSGGASPNPDSGGSGQTDGSMPGGPAAPDGPSVPDGPQTNDASPAPGGSGADASGTDIKLTLNRTDIELNKAGATFQLRYTVDPDIYDGLAVFTSSDGKVATVDESGAVKAVAPGKATITVKYDSAVATATVNCDWDETPDGPASTHPVVILPGGPPASADDPSTSADDPAAPGGAPESGDDPAAPGGGASESGDDPAASGDGAPESANVDLSAFYSAVTGKYTFAMPMLADDEILDNFYSGMTGIGTEQRLIYICASSMNNGEFGLVQVKDGKDVDAVKKIFQARIDAQAGGGAWYPMAVENWMNNSRVVSNGNYVMMVVHESCDDIVKEFNALF